MGQGCERVSKKWGRSLTVQQEVGRSVRGSEVIGEECKGVSRKWGRIVIG